MSGGSPDRPASALGRWQTLALLVVYLGVVSVTAYRHELFRDEVRALLIAHRTASLRDLLAALHNEGHPPLWYLVLRAASSLGGLRAIKPLAIAIAASAVFLFLSYSPFPRYQKVLFVFGALPLYEYSVMCRNYGIVMLLLFLVAMAWSDRFVRPLRVACLLALLANCAAHALILTGAILVMLFLEYVTTRPANVRGFHPPRPSRRRQRHLESEVVKRGSRRVARQYAGTPRRNRRLGHADHDRGAALLRGQPGLPAPRGRLLPDARGLHQ
jgi:hypothetical protein